MFTERPKQRKRGGPRSSQARRGAAIFSWKAPAISDAFKSNLPYYQCLTAQRAFYAEATWVQQLAASLAGATIKRSSDLKTKPQMACSHTQYPTGIAVHADVGLSGYLEYEAWAGDGSNVLGNLQGIISQPRFAAISPKALKQVVTTAANKIGKRLVFTDLAQDPRLARIETYRRVAASLQTLKFETLASVIDANVLYGDLLPSVDAMKLHPMTRQMYLAIDSASRPFLQSLTETASEKLRSFGWRWLEEVTVALSPFLPPKELPRVVPQRFSMPGHAGLVGGPTSAPGAGGADTRDSSPESSETSSPQGQEPTYRYSESGQSQDSGDAIPPLDEPRPPALEMPEANTAEKAAAAMKPDPTQTTPETTSGDGGGDSCVGNAELQEAMTGLSRTIAEATAQPQWHSPRSDDIERTLRDSAFEKTPLEGSVTEGQEVSVRLDDHSVAGGEVFERASRYVDDPAAAQELLDEALPVSTALRAQLYPDQEEVTRRETRRTSGLLDRTRLPLANCSETVFLRHRTVRQPDRQGRPLLVLAADGSSSFRTNQSMSMKVLTAAWLDSTARTRIQVLAGLYHSGVVHGGVSRPLVQWLYHPQNSPVANHRQAIDAVAAIPDGGSGAQSDALSLAFILDEAKELARGQAVYLVILSDFHWNRSFNRGLTAEQEVKVVLEQAYDGFRGKLHITLVGLGVSDKDSGFETAVDNVIKIRNEDLNDYVAVAKQIGTYVATCIRERRKVMAESPP